MLKLSVSMKDLSFGRLMEIYREGNLEKGEERWPEFSEDRRLLLAEQDFYDYLYEIFFRTPGAVYALWEDDGVYCSALRLEPYRDGLLLEALETAYGERRKGYAEKLIRAVQHHTAGTKLYSHVHKSNIPSLKIHDKCGFQRTMEYAAYIDGSFNHRCCTMVYINEPSRAES